MNGVVDPAANEHFESVLRAQGGLGKNMSSADQRVNPGLEFVTPEGELGACAVAHVFDMLEAFKDRGSKCRGDRAFDREGIGDEIGYRGVQAHRRRVINRRTEPYEPNA